MAYGTLPVCTIDVDINLDRVRDAIVLVCRQCTGSTIARPVGLHPDHIVNSNHSCEIGVILALNRLERDSTKRDVSLKMGFGAMTQKYWFEAKVTLWDEPQRIRNSFRLLL